MTKQERLALAEANRKKVLSLKHLPVWKIVAMTGITDHAVRNIFQWAKIPIVTDEEKRREKLRMACATKKKETDHWELNMTPKASVAKDVLVKARAILGETGDINRAAQYAGMAPERLQRCINHMR